MSETLETALQVPRPQRSPSFHGSYLHRTDLRARITAAHAGGLTAIAARAETLNLFRAAFERGRTLIRQAFERDGGGLACAGRLAHLEDELIREVVHYVTTHVHPAKFASTDEACAIAAVGGYGRATLAPFSDIDLLFILPPAGRARSKLAIDPILYMIWDLGQKIGHSMRVPT
jgi:[protein-PII] uridylyltransferase